METSNLAKHHKHIVSFALLNNYLAGEGEGNLEMVVIVRWLLLIALDTEVSQIF